MNKLAKLLGIELPIIQAPMAGAHGSDPKPPAWATAIANSLPCTPAIGA